MGCLGVVKKKILRQIKTDADEYLTNAKVTVFDEDKEEIYHVAAAWQRGGTS